MNAKRRELYAVTGVLAATLALGGYFAYRNRPPSPERLAAHSETWLEGPRAALRLMTERYGPPDALRPGVAVWHERGPWKRIVVHGEEYFDYLEQAVGYRVPARAAEPLTEFDHGLRFDRINDELSARSSDESLNFLALNLADEVASAKRGARDAGDFYVRTARLAAAGKSSPYLERLRFEPYRPAPQEPWNREIGY